MIRAMGLTAEQLNTAGITPDMDRNEVVQRLNSSGVTPEGVGVSTAGAASGGGVVDFVKETALSMRPLAGLGPSVRDIGETIGNVPKSAGNLWEGVKTLPKFLNPASDESTVLREAMFGAPEALVRGILPEGAEEAVIGGPPSRGAGIAAAIGKAELDRLTNPGKAIKEDPVGALLDVSSVLPVARMTTLGKLGRAGEATAEIGAKIGSKAGPAGEAVGRFVGRTEGNPIRALGEAVTGLRRGASKRAVQKLGAEGEGLPMAAAEAVAGGVSGVHSRPLRAERIAKREQVATEGIGAALRDRPAVKGFEDLLVGEDSLPDISRRVAEEIVEKVPREANQRWRAAFRDLALKNADDPISFSDIRQRMFDSLRRKYGINATGFAQGETVLDFSTASPQLRDGLKDQQIIQELVDKMDALTQRYKGLDFGKGRDNFRRGGPISERRRTYTAEDMHDELVTLRKSQIDRAGSVSTRDGEGVVNDLVGIFRGELGRKLDGFNDMQRARQKAFQQTEALLDAFGFKKTATEMGRRRKVQTADEAMSISAQSRIEQLLSSKPTHAERRQAIETFQAYLKEEFGRTVDLEQAVARLRTSTFNPQGIVRAAFPIGGAGLAVAGAASGDVTTLLGGLLGAMTLANPAFNAAAFRFLGASQGVADKIADMTRGIRTAAAAKGINLTDAVTVGVALQRLDERGGSLLSKVGTSPQSPQPIP